MLWSQVHNQQASQRPDQNQNANLNRGRGHGHGRQRSQSSPAGNLNTVTQQSFSPQLPRLEPNPKGNFDPNQVHVHAGMNANQSVAVRATLVDFPPLPPGGDHIARRAESAQAKVLDESRVFSAGAVGPTYASLFAKEQPSVGTQLPQTRRVDFSSAHQIPPASTESRLTENSPQTQLNTAHSYFDHRLVVDNQFTSPLRDRNRIEDSMPLPHFANLFCPRFPPEGGFFGGKWPIPRFGNIDHAMAVKERLTRFHAGVLLVDSLAGYHIGQRLQGLKTIVEENMPGLAELGVQAHHIVFYYHGRGERQTGFDIWNTIVEWEEQQRQLKSTRRYGSDSQKDRKQVSSRNTDDNLEVNVQEKNSRQPTRREKEREQLRQANTGTSSWNSFAKHEAMKSCERGREEEPQNHDL